MNSHGAWPLVFYELGHHVGLTEITGNIFAYPFKTDAIVSVSR